MITPYQERRLFERMPVNCPARYSSEKEAFGQKLTVYDFSAAGFRLISQNQPHQHQTLKLDIKVPDGQEYPLSFEGRVTWSRPVNNYWEAGLRLKEIQLLKMSRLQTYALHKNHPGMLQHAR